MKIKLVIAISSILAAGSANASVVFSDVSITANSVTFTATGDLSGYTAPSSQPYAFAILYSSGMVSGSGSSWNSWGVSPFASNAISNTGKTGTFDSNSYTWVFFESNLTASTFSGTPTTVTFESPFLNAIGTGTLDFIWGRGYIAPIGTTLLQQVSLVNGVSPSAVPVPAAVWLFASGLLGLGALRKKVQA